MATILSEEYENRDLKAPVLFDSHETAVLDRAFGAIVRVAPGDAALLGDLQRQLDALLEILCATPSLRESRQLGASAQTEPRLIDQLCGIDGLSGDLALPMKATLSSTVLLAKIDFFRAMVQSMDAQVDAGPEFRELSHELREELAQSIYTQLAEELLLALLRKPNIDRATKRQAADQLITIWDNAELEIDDFCPLLESAWRARNHVTSGFGALLGATEYFRLVSEDCANQFLDFFARDEMSQAEGQAFEEFLFNMTYEELQTLRATMKRQGRGAVDAEWASGVLNRTIEELDHSGEIDPMALYRSYYRRQLAADYRILAGTDGPRRTAEAYLMIYLLEQLAQAREGTHDNSNAVDPAGVVVAVETPAQDNHEAAVVKILMLASDPSDAARAAVQAELSGITDKLCGSRYADAIEFSSAVASTVDELRAVVAETQPHIVHFSGPGACGVQLADERGALSAAAAPVLGEVFTGVDSHVRVVVFSACYAAAQADPLVDYIDCAVGMTEDMGRDGAVSFTAAFYRALGVGRSVKSAWDVARAALRSTGAPPDQATLLIRDELDPSTATLVAKIDDTSPFVRVVCPD